MPSSRVVVAALCLVVVELGAALVGQEPTLSTPAQPATAADAGVQRYDQPAPGGRSPRNANYDIDVTLDHRARTLRGRQTIRWRNITSSPTSELQFHLYWNAWRNADSTWLRERRLAGARLDVRPDAWSSLEITALRVRHGGADRDLSNQTRFIAPDDGNTGDRTVLAVPLPVPVSPLETIEVDVEWTSRIPRPFARTGYIDDYYFIAQWFPKIGVLEDTGWNAHQFHASTEFYADYGTYDVRITLPREFVVGASGAQVRRTENPNGTTTHTYRAEDVADFAWTASPHFVEASREFEHPSLPRVRMRLLMQPEHAGQEARHFAATAATLKYYGEWFGPYPYGQITIVDPAWQSLSGGMEYPTLFAAGTRWLAPREVTTPEAVTVHEAGHQFWYGIVGNNEVEHAWMDEGINTFATARVIEEMTNPNDLGLRFFGTFVPWVLRDVRLRRETDGNRLNSYRSAAESDVQATPTYRYSPATAGAISYDKTALWLHTLERHLGWPVTQRILATFFERWKFRHPRPENFFAVVNDVSGRDMTWFFDQVYRSSNTFDYGVQDFISERTAAGAYRTTTVVRRFGEATFPVDVVTTFQDGTQMRERWNGLDRRAIYVYERPSRAKQVQVDPGRVLLLDVNDTNNSRTLEPRGAEASLNWSLTWMAWLQELMLTLAFFV